MRALLISEIFPPKTGGSGRWFWELYRRLGRAECVVAAGEDVRQVVFDQSHDLHLERLPLTLPAWGLRSWRGLTGYSAAVRRLRRLARSTGVDRVHAGRVLPEGVMAWCLKRWTGLPYLCYVHGEEITCTSESRELRWMARRVVAHADLLVANSRNTARIATQLWGADPGRVRVLHPGVDATRFHPAARDAAARVRLGWGERPVILTVGRLQKRKGHDRMIEALHEVRRRVPDVLYAVMGDGEERAALESLAAREGLTDAVRFHGDCDDAALVAAYQQCDLFVLPNRQVGADIEGFGLVLLEAQACGKPVIAGDSGGTAETMNEPATGRVFDCTNSPALGQLVADWLSDRPRLDSMGHAARAWVLENFDWPPLVRAAADHFRRPGDLAKFSGEALGDRAPHAGRVYANVR